MGVWRDRLFRFSVVVILKLSEMERDLCQKGLFEYISVQVAVSLTWFIRRLAANYLGFDPQSYQDGEWLNRESETIESLF